MRDVHSLPFAAREEQDAAFLFTRDKVNYVQLSSEGDGSDAIGPHQRL